MTKVYEAPTSLNYETDYTYNVLDALTQVSQGSGTQTRSFTYDGMGRLIAATTPEAGSVSSAYNAYNLPATTTDARGVIANFSYDTLNRITGVSYNVGSTGVTGTSSVSYSYGTSSSSNNNGRLISMTDGTGSESYTYDILGRMTAVGKVVGGTTYTTNYAYNLANEATQLTYPSGRVVAQTYDAIGRLCGVGASSSTCTSGTRYASGYNYNTAGEVTGFTYGNGVVSNISYSPDRLQLHCLQYDTTSLSDPCTKDSSALFMLTYAYGSSGANNGQISGITDGMDSGRTAAYTYDALGRLSTAGTTGSTGYAAWGLSWNYDLYGNRTAQNNTGGSVPNDSLTISASTNRVTGTGYSYDAAGNMTGDYVNTLTYDATSRLISSSNGSSSGAYAYDGKGMRVKKCLPNCSSPTSSTTYIYSGGKVIEEYDGVGNPSTNYIYSGSQLVASVGPDVTNGGFESGLSGWSTGSGVTLVTDASRAHSGSNYVQLSASPTEGPEALWGTTIAVTPGEQITFGGWVYRESGTGGAVGWLIQTDDATLAPVSWIGASPYPVSSTGAWTYEVSTYTIPSGVAYVQFYCTIFLPTTSTVARFDDGFLMAGVDYYHPDHLSNRVITNTAGTVIEQMGHLPYGENWYDTASDKWKFTTYERDAESGNDYAMARYNVNRLGRFSSPDPLGGQIATPQSLNHYVYASDDPLNMVDPSGMSDMFEGGGYCSGDYDDSMDISKPDTCQGAGGNWIYNATPTDVYNYVTNFEKGMLNLNANGPGFGQLSAMTSTGMSVTFQNQENGLAAWVDQIQTLDMSKNFKDVLSVGTVANAFPIDPMLLLGSQVATSLSLLNDLGLAGFVPQTSFNPTVNWSKEPAYSYTCTLRGDGSYLCTSVGFPPGGSPFAFSPTSGTIQSVCPSSVPPSTIFVSVAGGGVTTVTGCQQ